MRFASLGSGSRGNATLVEVAATTILIDNGFSTRETCKRLERLNKNVQDIDAILITHEHGDHIAGVGPLARKHDIPIWLTEGTFQAAQSALQKIETINLFNTHEFFSIKDVQIEPVTVPHDAKEPSQFVFNDGDHRLGLLTDTGSITPHIINSYHACHALILECNHDSELLANSVYPLHLKQRIASRFGHLENQQAASLLANIDTSNLSHIIAAHISEKNNAIAQVKTCLAETLSCEQDWIGIADQEEGFSWREITS